MIRSILRSLLIVFMLTFTSGSVHAQSLESRSNAQPSGQISGQVRLANSNQPAANILISCDDFYGGFVGQERTDRNGRFSFRGLKPSQFTITVRLPGYIEEQQTVELQTTSNAYVQFQLKVDPSAAAKSTPVSNLVVDVSIPPEAQKEYEAGREALFNDKKGADTNQGVQHLEKAVAIYPKFIDAQILLGTAYMDLKQWDKAEGALRRAIEIDPKSASVHFALGEIYRRQKKYREAETELFEGLKLDDKSVQGHLTLGRVYYEKGDLSKAGPQVGTALQLDPKLAEGHLLAGNILLRARHAEDALTEFEAYLMLAPNGEFAPQARDLVAKIKQALTSKKP